MTTGLNVPPGLLRFCLQHGDDPTASTLPERDPKDYEWLKQALGGMESEVDVMKKVITKLKSTEMTLEQRRILLAELQYLVEDLDNANELHKVGGLEVTLSFLSSSEDEATRMWCAWILTSLVQNNPKGVLIALETSAFEKVLLALSKETHPETRVRLLSALSGFLTAEVPSITSRFLQLQGLELLSLSLERTPKERLRALVILRNLLRKPSSKGEEEEEEDQQQQQQQSSLQLKELYRQTNILSKTASILKADNYHETTSWTETEQEELKVKALGLLSELVEGNPTNWRQLTQEGENLKDWVQQHIAKLLQELQQKRKAQEETDLEPVDPVWYSFLKQLRTEPTLSPLPSDLTTTVAAAASSSSTPSTNSHQQPLLLM